MWNWEQDGVEAALDCVLHSNVIWKDCSIHELDDCNNWPHIWTTTYVLYLSLRCEGLVVNAEWFLLRLSVLNIIQPVSKRYEAFTKFTASQQSNVQLAFSLCQLTKHTPTRHIYVMYRTFNANRQYSSASMTLKYYKKKYSNQQALIDNSGTHTLY